MLGKSRREVEDMFKKSDIVELNLTEPKSKEFDSDDDLRIFE